MLPHAINAVVFTALFLCSAPAGPTPKEVKLDEMAKAKQMSIKSFTRLGGAGDESKILKINHPTV